MRGMAAVASGVMMLCSASSTLPAQDDPCTTRTVVISVIDRQGNPVTGLTAANFRGRFRGKPVQIDSAGNDAARGRVVIVLDASGSMQGSAIWTAATVLAEDIARLTSRYYSVALVVFATHVVETVGFDEGYVPLATRLSALRAQLPVTPEDERKTALYDGISTAIALLRPVQPDDVIYVITDGDENRSRMRASQLAGSLTSAQARLFCFLIVNPDLPLRREFGEKYSIRMLDSMARASGGDMLTLFPVAEAPRVFWRNTKEQAAFLHRARRLYRQAQQTYRLRVSLPVPPDRPRDWNLQVTDDRGKQDQKVRILYPRKLLPCSDVQEED